MSHSYRKSPVYHVASKWDKTVKRLYRGRFRKITKKLIRQQRFDQIPERMPSYQWDVSYRYKWWRDANKMRKPRWMRK